MSFSEICDLNLPPAELYRQIWLKLKWMFFLNYMGCWKTLNVTWKRVVLSNSISGWCSKKSCISHLIKDLYFILCLHTVIYYGTFVWQSQKLQHNTEQWANLPYSCACCLEITTILKMATNLFFPSIRILRELKVSMPVISEIRLSDKFRKTSCRRFDRCWIIVIRLYRRLRSCSPSITPSWGHSSRERLENSKAWLRLHIYDNRSPLNFST